MTAHNHAELEAQLRRLSDIHSWWLTQGPLHIVASEGGKFQIYSFGTPAFGCRPFDSPEEAVEDAYMRFAENPLPSDEEKQR